ncbi:hypothetical protein BHAOGJBA_3691 [Methylobacterium hispanicum]|uniref:Chemotaxis protein CheZ n=1 Tax=Methylobacterium hispanicum TaxID=270350 RepID=A0AAV4ZNJ6_9HYPH|nr:MULTISPECIES: hypothetical protein [Methylobacterium]GJD90156.1 hypothetical protein BHAOGJBA_3691 [Methylobacterium hispanicum]
MSGYQSLTPYEPDAYEVIARAMAESERGRWFLDEHARRNRGPDTGTLLDAIARLESAVTAQRPPDDLAHLRGNLLDMANAISRTKAEIAAISAPGQDQTRLGSASEALDAIVRTTERATSDILGATEQMQEAAWLLRERGVEPEFCDRLDRHATQIYTACSFQDLTAQRTGRIVHTLRYLEDRLASMIAIWDAEGERVPQAPERAEVAADLCQSDVDRFIDAEGPAIPVSPLLGATALDDDLAFVQAPDSTEAFPADVMDAEPAADAIAFAAREPVVAAVSETAEIAQAETAEADLEVAEITVTEIEADVAPSFDIADSLTALEESILETPEPADVFASEGELEEIEALTLPTALEAEAPAQAEARKEEATSLDDIDLLSIEEKLALFS